MVKVTATQAAKLIAQEKTAGDQASELHKIMRLLVLVVTLLDSLPADLSN